MVLIHIECIIFVEYVINKQMYVYIIILNTYIHMYVEVYSPLCSRKEGKHLQ